MRIKNSFAAAVATAACAVVLSAAFQPAQAGYVTIDSFGDTATNTASSSSVGSSLSLQSVNQPISSVFNNRQVAQTFQQETGSGRTAALFSGTANVSGGIGTFGVTKAALPSGSSYGRLQSRNTVTWSNLDNSAVNLLGDGVGGFFNDAIRFVIPSFTASGPFGGNTQSLSVLDSDGNQAFLNWSFSGVPTGTTDIPFSSFTTTGPALPFKWGQVSSVLFDSVVAPSLGGTTAVLNNTIRFDNILAVPEPTQMVSVAAVGAAYGAWRMRKRRGRRAGDTVAG